MGHRLNTCRGNIRGQFQDGQLPVLRTKAEYLKESRFKTYTLKNKPTHNFNECLGLYPSSTATFGRSFIAS